MQQVQEIIFAVIQRGQHIVLFGERGVGKTSLANVLQEVLRPHQKDIIVSKVNCDVADDYSSLCKKIFQQIRVYRPKRGMGFVSRVTEVPVDLVKLLGEKVSPDTVRSALESIAPTTLIIVDEFDRTRTEQTPTLMADTIKSLSDYGVDATILVVGVADTVDELIREHQSIDRALVQVRLPRMSREELTEIVTKGLDTIPMQIDHDALEYIASLSQGLPHYTHLLAHLSALKAAESQRNAIQKADVRAAIMDAIHKTQQSIISLYHKATMSPRKESLYREVLLACALAPVDNLGYFAAPDVREPMSTIMKKDYDIPAFSKHLSDFCEEHRGPILQRTGTTRRFRFRFLNPLMQPYVVMQGIATGLIDETSVNINTVFSEPH